MASIHDVAKKAGVSIATVSRVINNHPVVTVKTRHRVEAAMMKLAYSPSVAARSLKIDLSKLVGFIVPNIENPFYGTLAKHMEAAAHEAGVSLVLCNTNGESSLEEGYIELLSRRMIDGILLSRTSLQDYSLQDAKGRDIPCVVLDRYAEEESFSSVRFNNSQAGRLAAKHLIELGHKNFICVLESWDVYPLAERANAFIEEIRKSGGTLHEKNVIEVGKRLADDSRLRNAVSCKKGKRHPTAIYCTNDLLACDAMQVLWSSGLHVPRDISIIGTDDIDQCLYVMPKLTTVGQPFAEIARKSIELLLVARDAANGDTNEPKTVSFEPYFIERESTAPPLA